MGEEGYGGGGVSYINRINYIKLEKELDRIAKLEHNYYKNKNNTYEITRIDKKIAEDMQYDYGILKNIALKEIQKRRKIFNKNNEQAIHYYDLPNWHNKTRCPFCNSKLIKKWEGLVCRGSCPLNFKCSSGWVLLQKTSGWSKSRVKINCFFSDTRNRLQREVVKLKKSVLIRDDYKCRKCGYSLADDFYREKTLDCHHIIPASEEMALFLDIDNLITLCNDCHKEVHREDKYNFSGAK